MERHVAFLRGMNLGGRRIKNEELRAEFETLGFEDVATFRASGNVIFSSSGKSEPALSGKVEAGLGDALGYEVPVFLRSCAEVARIAAAEPFDPKLVATSKGKLQVTFLAKKPAAAARRKVEALAASSTGSPAAGSANRASTGSRSTPRSAAAPCARWARSSRSPPSTAQARSARGRQASSMSRLTAPISSGSSASWTLATNSRRLPSGRKKLS